MDPRFPPKAYILEGAELPSVIERKLAYDDSSQGLVLTNQTSGAPNTYNPVISQWEWHNPDAYMSPETTRESSAPTLCARRWISLFPSESQPSELWPVQDGLLLNKLPLGRCVGGCRVVVPVRDLNLDLDQLNLLQDESFQALQDELVTELARLRALWETMKAPRRATTL